MLVEYHRIRNKDRKQKRVERKQIREAKGEQPLAPLKIEDKKEYDETYLPILEEDDIQEDQLDEFANYYNEKAIPKIVITTCRRPKGVYQSLAIIRFYEGILTHDP